MTTEDFEDDDIELDAETGPQYRSAFTVADRIWYDLNRDSNKRNEPKPSHADLLYRTINAMKYPSPERLAAMAVRDVRAGRQPRW